MKNKAFYSSSEISPDLAIIEQHRDAILEEVLKVAEWMAWPGHELQSEHIGWRIYPFYGFGTWNEEACSSCPVLASCLRKINGLKVASLSKLEGKTGTNKHCGCKEYSHTVIRCHYGLVVPPLSCTMTVVHNDEEKKEFHEKFNFLCFDDSKQHYAENRSNEDRIILILDIDRPSDIEGGIHCDGESEDLQEILTHFRSKNKPPC